jgi:hypothetical protein
MGALAIDAERSRPLAEIGGIIASAAGADSPVVRSVIEMINPYTIALEKARLRERFSPTVAGYLLSLQRIPQWVRGVLPMREICQVARKGVQLKPGVIGVYGSLNVFACWCEFISSTELKAGLYALRDPSLVDNIETVTAWGTGETLRIRVPNVSVGSNVLLEVVQ